MQKYRARWDSEHLVEPRWLTCDNQICVHRSEALEGPLCEIINAIARMSIVEPGTVASGQWTVERDEPAWTEVT